MMLAMPEGAAPLVLGTALALGALTLVLSPLLSGEAEVRAEDEQKAATEAAGGDVAKAFGALTMQVAEKLKAFNAVAGGSSRRVGRFRMLTTPPSLDAGEITDKGYENQRATQDSRAAEVASLFTAEAGPGVVQL
jgi:hypothetical protein